MLRLPLLEFWTCFSALLLRFQGYEREKFFGDCEVFLPVSSQLHLEALIR